MRGKQPLSRERYRVLGQSHIFLRSFLTGMWKEAVLENYTFTG